MAGTHAAAPIRVEKATDEEVVIVRKLVVDEILGQASAANNRVYLKLSPFLGASTFALLFLLRADLGQAIIVVAGVLAITFITIAWWTSTIYEADALAILQKDAGLECLEKHYGSGSAIARLDDQFIGFVAVETSLDKIANIKHLAVKHYARRNETICHLLQRAIDYAMDRKVTILRISVLNTMDRTEHLLQQYKFRKTGRSTTKERDFLLRWAGIRTIEWVYEPES
ncbi:hypothetical protein NEOLI_002512 [Neolecta irregularis DAH-3]|uniref:N-acetyltransferase domain-containing protein n=1 Tax=Neolecta irregularis (strain DAH-3) TaxID=1198029 RepID=A0A1U7LIB1_NEOID|nr:hypothetical protein NEOLI_002512 [Neolecta irregularis DAH-3]|eukprot:OLL22333.1 hypothetical protein NEOLI_002512 [Neolecta irregularis DAH-3]